MVRLPGCAVARFPYVTRSIGDVLLAVVTTLPLAMRILFLQPFPPPSSLAMVKTVAQSSSAARLAAISWGVALERRKARSRPFRSMT